MLKVMIMSVRVRISSSSEENDFPPFSVLRTSKFVQRRVDKRIAKIENLLPQKVMTPLKLSPSVWVGKGGGGGG